MSAKNKSIICLSFNVIFITCLQFIREFFTHMKTETILSATMLCTFLLLKISPTTAATTGSFFNDTFRAGHRANLNAKMVKNNIIRAAGGLKRWKRIRNIIRTSKVKSYDPVSKFITGCPPVTNLSNSSSPNPADPAKADLAGNSVSREKNQRMSKLPYLTAGYTERIIFEKNRKQTHLTDVIIDSNGKETAFVTNGLDTWGTVDGRLMQNQNLLEKALRRLRETWFWIRFPFSLNQRNTVLRLAGTTTLQGGRCTGVLLDVLPAQRGEGWPYGFIRLIVNTKSWLVEGVILPSKHGDGELIKGQFSNLTGVNGIFLPHLASYYNNEGLIAEETITGRAYNIRIPERIFQKPCYESW
jgi:hypothetical protein